MIDRWEVTPRTRLPVRLTSSSLIISKIMLTIQMKLYAIPGKEKFTDVRYLSRLKGYYGVCIESGRV